MVGPERLYLAHTLQLTEAQVRFYNKFLVATINNRSSDGTATIYIFVRSFLNFTDTFL